MASRGAAARDAAGSSAGGAAPPAAAGARLFWVERGVGSERRWLLGREYQVEGPSKAEQVWLRLEGTGAIVAARLGDCLPANDSACDTDNVAELAHVHEPGALHFLVERARKGLPCTWAGDVLVQVNSFGDEAPSVGAGLHPQLAGQAPCAACPESLADAAMARLSLLQESQLIVVSGESGSGKSSACAKVLWRLCAAPASKRLRTQLEHVEVVLQALGGAVVGGVGRGSSSRFTRSTKVFFGDGGAAEAAQLGIYLLETSRVTACAPGERSFNVFHQLLCGADSEDKERFGLSGLSSEDFVATGGAPRALAAAPPALSNFSRRTLSATLKSTDELFPKEKLVSFLSDMSDASDYARLLKALSAVGLERLERHELLGLLAGVLHLCNLRFDKDAETGAVVLLGGRDASSSSFSCSSSSSSSAAVGAAAAATSAAAGAGTRLRRVRLLTAPSDTLLLPSAAPTAAAVGGSASPGPAHSHAGGVGSAGSAAAGDDSGGVVKSWRNRLRSATSLKLDTRRRSLGGEPPSCNGDRVSKGSLALSELVDDFDDDSVGSSGHCRADRAESSTSVPAVFSRMPLPEPLSNLSEDSWSCFSSSRDCSGKSTDDASGGSASGSALCSGSASGSGSGSASGSGLGSASPANSTSSPALRAGSLQRSPASFTCVELMAAGFPSPDSRSPSPGAEHGAAAAKSKPVPLMNLQRSNSQASNATAPPASPAQQPLDHAVSAARLLGLPVERLRGALCAHAGSVSDAERRRDALARTLYACVVDWVVARINERLAVPLLHGPESPATGSLPPSTPEGSRGGGLGGSGGLGGGGLSLNVNVGAALPANGVFKNFVSVLDVQGRVQCRKSGAGAGASTGAGTGTGTAPGLCNVEDLVSNALNDLMDKEFASSRALNHDGLLSRGELEALPAAIRDARGSRGHWVSPADASVEVLFGGLNLQGLLSTLDQLGLDDDDDDDGRSRSSCSPNGPAEALKGYEDPQLFAVLSASPLQVRVTHAVGEVTYSWEHCTRAAHSERWVSEELARSMAGGVLREALELGLCGPVCREASFLARSRAQIRSLYTEVLELEHAAHLMRCVRPNSRGVTRVQDPDFFNAAELTRQLRAFDVVGHASIGAARFFTNRLSHRALLHPFLDRVPSMDQQGRRSQATLARSLLSTFQLPPSLARVSKHQVLFSSRALPMLQKVLEPARRDANCAQFHRARIVAAWRRAARAVAVVNCLAARLARLRERHAAATRLEAAWRAARARAGRRRQAAAADILRRFFLDARACLKPRAQLRQLKQEHSVSSARLAIRHRAVMANQAYLSPTRTLTSPSDISTVSTERERSYQGSPVPSARDAGLDETLLDDMSDEDLDALKRRPAHNDNFDSFYSDDDALVGGDDISYDSD